MAVTPVKYEEAVSFSEGLLALRKKQPFSVQAGPQTTIRVVPHRRLLDATEEKLRYCEDSSLKTVRFDLEVYDREGRWDTAIYISAGYWSDSPRALFENGRSHFLLIHDRRRLCAQQVNLRSALVRRGGHLSLTVAPRFPKGGAELTQRLVPWMKKNALIGIRGKRLELGDDDNWKSLLCNLLILGLAKQHLRGIQIVQSWVESLVPSEAQVDHETATAIFDDEDDEFDIEEETTPVWSGLLLTNPPPTRSRSRQKAQAAGKADFVEVNARAKEIGDAGEELVLQWERASLVKCGRSDLADKVVHVAGHNDSAGYDILSFTSAGKPVYIEVKTTTGGPHSAFYLTAGELSFSRQHKKNFRLYRLYDYNENPKRARFFLLQGDLSVQLALEASVYRAWRK